MPAFDQSPVVFELLKGLPAAFVALVIGGVAAAIAWRQMRIAQAKLKLDLFDKRYRLYELLRVFLSDGMESDDEQRLVELRSNFSQCVPQAYFLFGKEIGDYFNEICEAAEKHRLRAFELRNLKDPAARRRISEPHSELTEWLQKQRSGLPERFGPYMDFETWR